MEKRNELLLDVFENLPYKAKSLIFDCNDILRVLDDVSVMIEDCQSPIEKILLVALTKKFEEIDTWMYIETQTLIECNGKNYYADFTICYDEMLNWYLKEDFNLIIECDGYDFHQKTKEQVDYDNKREYDLKAEGWDIIRFSGREIYNNPMQCVERILKYIAIKNK